MKKPVADARLGRALQGGRAPVHNAGKDVKYAIGPGFEADAAPYAAVAAEKTPAPIRPQAWGTGITHRVGGAP